MRTDQEIAEQRERYAAVHYLATHGYFWLPQAVDLSKLTDPGWWLKGTMETGGAPAQPFWASAVALYRQLVDAAAKEGADV